MEEVCLSPRETIRIVILGDHKVGKTTFLKNNINIHTDCDGITTDPTVYMRNYVDGVSNINFMFIDTPGHISLKNLNKYYIETYDTLIFAFDLSNEGSFYGLIRWIEEVKKINRDYNNGTKPIILLGIDKGRPIITHNVAEDFAKRHGFIYIPSCIEEPVEEIYRQIINYRLKLRMGRCWKKHCMPDRPSCQCSIM